VTNVEGSLGAAAALPVIIATFCKPVVIKRIRTMATFVSDGKYKLPRSAIVTFIDITRRYLLSTAKIASI
jgi:hypothetical protein